MIKRLTLLGRLFVILCSTIIFVSMTTDNNLGQTIKIKERLSKQKESIEVSSIISEKTVCSTGDILLKVSVNIKNLRTTPIVFCKECMTNVALFVSRDIDLLYQNKFVYDLDSFTDGISMKLINPLPFEKPFITLTGGESFSFSVEPRLINFDSKKPILKKGSYVFVQVIDTWGDFTNLDDELKIRWKKEGLFFWTDKLITEPIAVKIGKTKILDCQTFVAIQ